MSRLAFFTPLPPAGTGIADYSVDVLSLLADDYRIDVFHDQAEVDPARLPPPCGLFPAATFLERHRSEPYDLAVYQLGNSGHHSFLYDLLPRVPGLLVLHDLVLHHARARVFLDSDEARAYAEAPWDERRRALADAVLDRYRAEIAYVYPRQAGRLEAVHLGTIGDLLPYAYPLFRLPVEVSRLTAVHNDLMANAIVQEVEGVEVTRVAMPVVRTHVTPEEVSALRARFGLGRDELVVGSFGLMTREKRIEVIARAVARCSAALPIRLLLVGPIPESAFLQDILERTGVASRTIVTGSVPFEQLPAHIEAANVVVQLRYPTGRETSAALLRVLAQGRPTIISDLAHLEDIPKDAVARVDPSDEEGDLTRALLRLGESPPLRDRLGRNAAAFVSRQHSVERCRADYQAAVARAIALPDPAPRPWPAHWAR
jgi:glycosyltransferase involved in cell wall biosynthesis